MPGSGLLPIEFKVDDSGIIGAHQLLVLPTASDVQHSMSSKQSLLLS
jgi:hypothetical protein